MPSPRPTTPPIHLPIVLLLLAGCAAAVRVTHMAPPDKLGPDSGSRLSRLYILVRAPQPLDADAGKVADLLSALQTLAPEKDKTVRRDLTPQERESLARAVAQRFTQAASVAAYQAVYEEAPPAAMAGFAPTASLWLKPTEAQARQDSFEVEVSSTERQTRYKVRGEYSIAWRLLSEPGRALLAEGRIPSGNAGFEDDRSAKVSDLDSVLRAIVHQRQDELVNALSDGLLPHPVERVRTIRKGKGLFKDAFQRLSAQDWEGAAALWRQVMSLNPDDRTPHHHMGVYFERLKRWDDAHREYAAAADAAGESGQESREALAQLDSMARTAAVEASTIPFLTERVAVLPFANESVDMNAPVYMRLKTASVLKERGYAVQSVAETDAALRGIGITDGGQIRAADQATLARTVGADRLLFGVVEEFRTVNVGLYFRRQVRLSVRLTDSAGGELWSNRAQTLKQDLAPPKKALETFLVNLASTQVQKAFKMYLTDEATLTVMKVLEPLPRQVVHSGPKPKTQP